MVNRRGVVWSLLAVAAAARCAYYYRPAPWKGGESVKVTGRVGYISQGAVKTVTIQPAGIEIDLPRETEVELGHTIEAFGKLEKRLIEGSDPVFVLNYRDFGYYQVSTDLLSFAQDFRKKTVRDLGHWIAGNEGSLAAGILVGGNEGWTTEGLHSFRTAGLTHVTAASGYNVQLVVASLFGIGVKLIGRVYSIYFGILGCILYVLLAGGGPPIVRAGIMSVMGLLALLWGRKSRSAELLVWSGLGLVLVKPDWLSDVSFQLSFAASAGLVWVEPLLGSKWWLNDMKITTAVLISTWPLTTHYFGVTSLLAPLVNGLVLWVIPAVMHIAGLAVMVGTVWDTGGELLALAAWPGLHWMVWLAEKVSGLSWAVWRTSRIEWWGVVLYYLILWGGVVQLQRRHRGAH